MTTVVNGFETATAAEPQGDGRYGCHLDPGWSVHAGPNGGYVAALLLRAILHEAGPLEPRALTVTYLEPGREGDAAVEVQRLRSGRSLSVLSAQLRQADRLLATGTALLGSGRSSLEFQDADAGDVPPPEDAPLPPAVPEGLWPPIADRFEFRPLTAALPFSGTEASFGCWLRLREERGVDPVLLAQYADAMAPAVMFRSTTPVLAPTTQLSVYFRQRPLDDDPWVLARVASRCAAEGFVEEDCDLYDRSGRLLAQSRQLAVLVPLT